VNDTLAKKVSQNISDADILEVISDTHYVSRAAEKLLFALAESGENIKDKVALDIGSSTGGFTQVMLEAGVASVDSVDVGTEQFDKSLLNKYKEKINLFENTDIRNFENNKKYNLIVTDVSFISLNYIIEKIIEVSDTSCLYFLLFKPQFEVGKGGVNREGKVIDDALALEKLEEFKNKLEANDIKIIDTYTSPITGKDGNIEYIVYATR
jgi:23S rRNA (cytidine1920-2'-O)/16S rRNA (cytidine1409-2'-O)-methyltransferase